MNVNYYFCMYKSYFFVVVVAALLPRMHIMNILPASAYKHTEAAFFFGCFFFCCFCCSFTHVFFALILFSISFPSIVRFGAGRKLKRKRTQQREIQLERDGDGVVTGANCVSCIRTCVCVWLWHTGHKGQGGGQLGFWPFRLNVTPSTQHCTISCGPAKVAAPKLRCDSRFRLNWLDTNRWILCISIMSLYFLCHDIWFIIKSDATKLHIFTKRSDVSFLCAFFFSSFYSFLACHRRVAHQKWPIHAERTYLQSASWKWSQITQPTHEANFMMITSCFYWPNQWLMITRSVESSSKSLNSTGLRACEPFVIAIRLPSSPPYIPPLDQLK